MNLLQVPSVGEARGRATYGMANLRTRTTGLPFVVVISQKDGARHDVRLKVAAGAKVRPEEMGSYQLRPFHHTGGPKLPPHQAALLRRRIDANMAVLVDYWDGRIEYTEDAIERITSI